MMGPTRRTATITSLTAAAALAATAAIGCGDSTDDGDGGSAAGAGWSPGGSSAGGSAGSGGTGSPGGGGTGGTGAAGATGGTGGVGDCLAATGPGATGTDTYDDDPYQADVTIDGAATCQRTYHLATDAPLRDGLPDNPRTFGEQAGWPVVRTAHDMFDALYALALEEVRENSVDSIQDGAFNGGQPMPCPPGGCFETGRLWTYVWTRDIAYATSLGLGVLDPPRARNSLEFKTSERRGGGDRQIVQDTGTGGSYAVSTDRVVWSIGAWELLKYLDGADRDAFVDLAYEAARNTAEHDRVVVFDGTVGLYAGEQSFLDWREQSYPAWTATDTVQIGMSKALSTNVGHLALLELAAALATEKGLGADSTKYQGWADSLRTAIADRFYLAGPGQFSTFTTTFLDPAPTHRYDLLGSALAVLHDVGSSAQRESAVASYPHLPQGPPVLWPQQQAIPIYHNRGIWPFVTAYWLRAAKHVGNAAVIDHNVASLMRGAALYLSNMENFEAATGLAWLDEGATSGPVVNSHRQVWSVAGYVSMVQDIVFGLEANQTGIRFRPAITRGMRNGLFAGAESIALSGLPYRGRSISVRVVLDDVSNTTQGVLTVQQVTLDGTDVGTGFIPAAQLAQDSVIEVTLGAPDGSPGTITSLDAAAVADYRNLFGPHTPAVSSVTLSGSNLQITIDPNGESPADITFDVYRDGQLVGSDLPGSTTQWVDSTSTQHATHSYCYSVQTRFITSETASQHARPNCYWGSSYERIQTVSALDFQAVGGTLVFNYGKNHYEGWGAPGDTLTVPTFVSSYTGTHYIQLEYGNGAGPFSTGITCAIKLVEVKQGANTIASGYLLMPQLATWDAWTGSSFLAVELTAGQSYSIVIREDEHAINMSERAHFETYEHAGGQGGRYNYVNIAEVKVLAASML